MALRFIGQPLPHTHAHFMRPGELVRGISKHEFKARRDALFAQVRPGDALVFVSNEEKYFSHDANFKFSQNTTFSYLFGFLEPQSVAVMVDSKVFLFSRNHDPVKEMWDGPICGPRRALDLFGCENTFGIDVLDKVLPALVSHHGAGNAIVVSSDLHFAKQTDLTVLARVHAALHTNPDTNLPEARRILSLVDKQRVVKTPAEIACIRQACEVTGNGHTRAMQQRLRCGNEREMQSEVEYGFRNGGDGTFYQSIVAGGARACTLHYTANDVAFSPHGELCLIDAGARLLGSGYGGDVTRTFPVLRERFSGPERDVYLAVLDCLDYNLSITKPGVSMQELHLAALTRLQANLSILFAQPCTLEQTRKYFPHGVGHYLGLDVHDTPTVGRTELLQPGAVVTVEPGLYFPAHDEQVPQHLRGIGIRLEDNALLVSGGCENLTRPFAPIELAHVEDLSQV